MDEIFRISGSFAKGLEWHKNGPHYEGSIIITPGDEVFGVADMYHGDYEQTRFLYGKIVPLKKELDSLLLLMLAPKEPDKALFVVIPDIDDSDRGEWTPVSCDVEKTFLDCNCQNLVGFDLRFVDYSSMERRRIKYSYFYHLSRSDEYNFQLIQALDTLSGTMIEHK